MASGPQAPEMLISPCLCRINGTLFVTGREKISCLSEITCRYIPRIVIIMNHVKRSNLTLGARAPRERCQEQRSSAAVFPVRLAQVISNLLNNACK